MATGTNHELRVAEEIVSVLPGGSFMRVCSDEHNAIRYAVRSNDLKLRSVVLSRASLRRLVNDPARNVKIEYLQRDLLRSAKRRSEFSYPRAIKHLGQTFVAGVRKAVEAAKRERRVHTASVV